MQRVNLGSWVANRRLARRLRSEQRVDVGKVEVGATGEREALPEVVGDAGLMVEPTHIDALAAALGRVLDDEAYRSELQRRSLHRAAQFTWAHVAERTLDSYRACMIDPHGTEQRP